MVLRCAMQKMINSGSREGSRDVEAREKWKGSDFGGFLRRG